MSEHQQGPLSFRRPPIAEVALSVQFATLPSFGLTYAGLLWAAFRDRFPRTEEYPPLPRILEDFDDLTPAKIQIRVESANIPMSTRYWFLDESGVKLIQVQHDRFVVNWRRFAAGTEAERAYPRYGNLRETFRLELARFVEIVNGERSPSWLPDLCEISYVNELEITHADIPAAIALWNPPIGDQRLSSPEDITILTRYVIRNDNGNPIGRLHFQVQPAIRAADSTPVVLMTVTARVRPQSEGILGVLQAMDLAHDWAIHAFRTLTTAEIKTTWEQPNGD